MSLSCIHFPLTGTFTETGVPSITHKGNPRGPKVDNQSHATVFGGFTGESLGFVKVNVSGEFKICFISHM